MKEQGRPTLTLRRKAASEDQGSGDDRGEERHAGTGSVRRRPAPEPVYRKVMPLADALALLEVCWPALVVEGKPQLLAVGIREAMLADIRERGLGISGKALKRCLSAITRSEVYLDAMTADAWRKNLAGEPVAQVGVDDAACAAERKAQESRKRTAQGDQGESRLRGDELSAIYRTTQTERKRRNIMDSCHFRYPPPNEYIQTCSQIFRYAGYEAGIWPMP